MNEQELKLIIEALLLSNETPLTLQQILTAFDEWEKPQAESVLKAIDLLQKDYQERSLELIEVATGYQIQTKSKYSTWIAKLNIEKPAKYSRAVLETLAIIAYKQPVTRADIEDIRGVSVNTQTIKSLIERGWIRIAGLKDAPGKPAVYTTTIEFLDYFNLQYLHQLPELPDIVEI
jgi:segregation and condensation protein B